MGRFTRTLKSYKNSDSGHVAVIFALMAVPILMLAGVAIDMNTVNANRARVSAALDSAALSAVTDQTLTPDERASYAKQVFWDNLGEVEEKVELTVLNSEGTEVALTAKSEIERTFPLLDDNGLVEYTENATAELTYGDVVCMLALAPEGKATFLVDGGANLFAATCNVQVNSKDAYAAYVNYGAKVLAKNFCVSGDVYDPGSGIQPYVNTQCGEITDPFAEKVYAGTEPCTDQSDLIEQRRGRRAFVKNLSLEPGTFCGGLDLSQKTVTFAPGTYVIKDGPLRLGAGSIVDAVGATFVMQGEDAVLIADSGSVGRFVAPSDGEFAGLTFFQDIHTNAKNFKTLPTGTSIVNSGSNVSIVGIVYLPEQKLDFRGGSILENRAPATSFIANNISLSAGAQVFVAVDHVSAGIPAIEPRTDDSARLSK